MPQVIILLLLTAVASQVSADDTDSELLKPVSSHLIRWSRSDCGRNTVLASATRAGAEMLAREWLIKNKGKVVGWEIADSFVASNESARPVESSSNLRFPILDVSFNDEGRPDWTKLDEEHPGTQCVIVLSVPGEDLTQTLAIVRADLHRRDQTGSTTLLDLERDPNGTWRVQQLMMGMFQSPNDTEGHLHLPNDAEYFHTGP